jgi:hypothetical protein
MNPLCITISLLWFPVYYIWAYSHHTVWEYGLMSLLVSAIATAYWFWSNPLRNSLAHTVDAATAKLCIGTFIVYTFSTLDMIELKLMYMIVLSYIGFLFWKSNYESEREWCSRAHIQSHMLLHFFCFVATFFVVGNLRFLHLFSFEMPIFNQLDSFCLDTYLLLQYQSA